MVKIAAIGSFFQTKNSPKCFWGWGSVPYDISLGEFTQTPNRLARETFIPFSTTH